VTPFPKRPRTPRLPLTREPDDILVSTDPLWRVHRTEGPYVLAWDTLRHWGPAANCRWEPHPEHTAVHPGEGVAYVACDLATAVVESFQDTRRIDPNSGGPRATSWEPTRPLRLLDLTDDWCLRNGASAALTSAPRAWCRAWARAIRMTWPDLDGLRTLSVLTGRTNVTLWSPAADSFPERPAFSEPLSDDLLWDRLDRLAYRYRDAGYRLV
jgi:hypothetical protein